MSALAAGIGFLIGAALVVCALLALLWCFLNTLATIVVEVNGALAEAFRRMRRWLHWRGIAIRSGTRTGEIAKDGAPCLDM
jgi:uncharacterized membrane protein YqiK